MATAGLITLSCSCVLAATTPYRSDSDNTVALVAQGFVFLFMYVLLQHLVGAFQGVVPTFFFGVVIICAGVGFFSFTLRAILRDVRKKARANDDSFKGGCHDEDGGDGDDETTGMATSSVMTDEPPNEETIEIEVTSLTSHNTPPIESIPMPPVSWRW